MAKSALTLKATSAKSDLWGTPRALAASLVKEFDLQVDVAACAATAVCPTWYGPDTVTANALDVAWKSRCFMNPPFSLLTEFVEKAVGEMWRGVVTVAVLPANKTEQPWWHDFVPLASEVRFLKGRLTYLEPELDTAHTGEDPVYKLNGNYQANAPALFPSCVVVWDGTKPKSLVRDVNFGWWDWRRDVKA